MAFVYSCCFWFSLRLGGILIGIFSLLQALSLLTICIIAQAHSAYVQETLSSWINNAQLGYSKGYFENLRDDPEKYITTLNILTCAYIVLTCLYIYGAYTFRNILMVGYILMEGLRLLAIAIVVATWLLVLKQNTMDIGLLIGASVAAGFALLGMFYLWVCATNLPIVINEMEHDEQAATITKLRQLLESNRAQNYNRILDDLPPPISIDNNLNPNSSRDAYTISNNFYSNVIPVSSNKTLSRPPNIFASRYLRPSHF